jgi:hypothetical protein
MGAANYCAFRGMIYRSFIYFRGKAGIQLFRRGGARLILGEHPARRLAARPELFAGRRCSRLTCRAVKGVLDDYFDCWFVTPPSPARGADRRGPREHLSARL